MMNCSDSAHIPSSPCGVVALKTTYCRADMRGMSIIFLSCLSLSQVMSDMKESSWLLFFIVFLLASSHLPFSASSDDTEVEDERPFSYKEGTEVGPRKWGEINPDGRICNTGNLQSPIDLTDRRVKIFPGLGKLQRHYKPAFATLKNRCHDLEMKWEGDAGHIVINGTVYNLQQFHWYSPAEHTFNGTRHNLRQRT